MPRTTSSSSIQVQVASGGTTSASGIILKLPLAAYYSVVRMMPLALPVPSHVVPPGAGLVWVLLRVTGYYYCSMTRKA